MSVKKLKHFGEKIKKGIGQLAVTSFITTTLLSPVTFSNFKPSPDKPLNVSISTLRAEDEMGKMSREGVVNWYKDYVENYQSFQHFAQGADRFYYFLNSSAFEKVVEDKEAVKAELIKRLERGRVKWSNGTPLVLYRSGGMEFGAFLTIDGAIHIGMNGQGIWIPLEDLQEIYYERTGRELEINSYMTREEQLELLKIAVEWFFDNYVLDAKIYRHKETGAELGVFFYKDFRESEKKGENVYKIITVHIYGEEAKKLHEGVRGIAYVAQFTTEKEITKLQYLWPIVDIYLGKYLGFVAIFNVQGEDKPSFIASFNKEKNRNSNKLKEENIASADTLLTKVKTQYVVLRDYH